MINIRMYSVLSYLLSLYYQQQRISAFSLLMTSLLFHKIALHLHLTNKLLNVGVRKLLFLFSWCHESYALFYKWGPKSFIYFTSDESVEWCFREQMYCLLLNVLSSFHRQGSNLNSLSMSSSSFSSTPSRLSSSSDRYSSNLSGKPAPTDHVPHFGNRFLCFVLF